MALWSIRASLGVLGVDDGEAGSTLLRFDGASLTGVRDDGDAFDVLEVADLCINCGDVRRV